MATLKDTKVQCLSDEINGLEIEIIRDDQGITLEVLRGGDHRRFNCKSVKSAFGVLWYQFGASYPKSTKDDITAKLA